VACLRADENHRDAMQVVKKKGKKGRPLFPRWPEDRNAERPEKETRALETAQRERKPNAAPSITEGKRQAVRHGLGSERLTLKAKRGDKGKENQVRTGYLQRKARGSRREKTTSRKYGNQKGEELGAAGKTAVS